ncbi:MAG: hypothetical protein CR990_00745, partial [Desulfococcus sp.]
LINAARQQGSRPAPACDAAGISVRTYQRWTKGDIMKPDGRPEAERGGGRFFAVPHKVTSSEESRAECAIIDAA